MGFHPSFCDCVRSIATGGAKVSRNGSDDIDLVNGTAPVQWLVFGIVPLEKLSPVPLRRKGLSHSRSVKILLELSIRGDGLETDYMEW